MNVGDRVALAAKADWTGTITRVKPNGHVDVDFDIGGKGKGMDTDDLREHEDPTVEDDRESDVRQESQRERERAKDDKSWPPSSMETKVPSPGGQK